MSDAKALFLLILSAILMILLLGYMMEITPDAMHSETLNQRAIAAGSWKHQPGYHDYLAFVEANNAQ